MNEEDGSCEIFVGAFDFQFELLAMWAPDWGTIRSGLNITNLYLYFSRYLSAFCIRMECEDTFLIVLPFI